MVTGEDWLQGMMDLVEADFFVARTCAGLQKGGFYFLEYFEMHLPYFDTLDIFHW